MPRKQKKYHYIYRTTCVVTGKFYVGMHSTDDLQDGYLGSGKILGYSLRKHGRESHKLEILEMCGSREQLKIREREIVNEELLAHPLNINLKYGGEGGLPLFSKEEKAAFHRAGWQAMQKNKDHRASAMKAWKKSSKSMLNAVRKNIAVATEAAAGSAANNKRKETFAKIGHSKREKNPNFGKRNACVTKQGTTKRIPLDHLALYIAAGWKRGMK